MIEKAREFQRNTYFCFINYAKDFDYVDHNTPWKTLKEMGIPDHLTYLLRNLYAGQEAIVRTGTTDWFQIGKGVCQGCILSPCLFNLYAEYIMRNAGLVEAQAGIKIAGRNINSLRYADDTTLMAESEEELKSLLMKVKEESENAGSVVPFSCPQSFPASGSFPMSQLFVSGGQSIGVSASTSVLPINTQDWSPLGWAGWISLQSKNLWGDSQEFMR